MVIYCTHCRKKIAWISPEEAFDQVHYLYILCADCVEAWILLHQESGAALKKKWEEKS